MRALVPSPLYTGVSAGSSVALKRSRAAHLRYRIRSSASAPDKAQLCPNSVMTRRCSSRRKGFNVVATANIRDRGVHEMSSALKRRLTSRPSDDCEPRTRI